MRYREIICERPTDDTSARAQAQIAQDLFARWFSSNETVPLAQLPHVTRLEGLGPPKYLVPATVVGLDLPDLSFGVHWGENTPFGSLLVYRDVALVKYAITLKTRSDPTDEVDVGYGVPWGSFVHEFMHYLDHKRGYTKALLRRPNLHATDAEPDSYYNSPLEFNAHFQQGIDHYLQRVAHDLHYEPDKARGYGEKLRSFAAFRADVVPWMPKHFDRFLRPNYQRKLTRRLYKLFQLMRAEWPHLSVLQYKIDALRQMDAKAAMAEDD
jgi:hypothetical protein